jgi:uncharacterized OsmC-like protein
MSQVLGCWISPCYGPFSLGGRFETYEPFISLIFKFFFRLRQTADTESAHMGAKLYCPVFKSVSKSLHKSRFEI